jgi:tyrosyl-tRNA synthetase
MIAKKRLARQLVTRFYDDAIADAAERSFESRFQRKEPPKEAMKQAWPDPAGNRLLLPAAIVLCGLAPSASEARRLIRQGAVRVDGERVASHDWWLEGGTASDEVLIQIGSRRAARLVGAKKSIQKG